MEIRWFHPEDWRPKCNGISHPKIGRFKPTSQDSLYVEKASPSFVDPMLLQIQVPPPKTNMTMENPPFEDVFPIEHGKCPMSC